MRFFISYLSKNILETVRAEPVEACSSKLRDALWLR